MNPRPLLLALTCGAVLAFCVVPASAAVVIVPRPTAGSGDVPAEVKRIAGYIGRMVRLVRAPSATSASGPDVRSAELAFPSSRGGRSSLHVSIKRSGVRAAFAIQAGHWMELTDSQYATLTEHLVLEARIAWACTGAARGGSEPAARNLRPLVFGAPKGNLLPQGADEHSVRLVVPPVAVGIPGPPAGCGHPQARVTLTATADLPSNYPSGVPLGTDELPVRARASLRFG